MSSPAELIASWPTPYELRLRFLDVPVRVRTNDPDVWTGLSLYYAPYLTRRLEMAADVRLVQGVIDVGEEFADLVRADGKRVKEAVRAVPGGRLILKRTTGVLMGLWPGHAFAAGELRGNLNQAINLVNACYAKAVLRRGHLLLHASGVSREGRAVVLAGPPGAGKSTAALHLVEHGFRFLSNDRVLVRARPDGVEALGYPKQPRVNPGTLLHHPRLSGLLKPEDHAALAALPQSQLWELERKSDVDLDALYGHGTVDLQGKVHALILLKWRLQEHGLSVRQLGVSEVSDNVTFVYKSLGAFDLDRVPGAQPVSDELAQYARLLQHVPVLEMAGRPDFAALVGIASAVCR